jgi:hypothetical protein
VRVAALAGILLAASLALPCRADEPEKPWYADIAFDAFVSASYSYNFNEPASATNGFRVFDFDDNTFKLDVAELVVQKPMSQPRDAGFRIDVALGDSIPRVVAAADPGSGTEGAQQFDLQQAFVGWVAPVGAGLRFDLGKFVTPFGYEVIDGYDGYNDDATRSFLFGFAIPFVHTGLRMSYPFGAKASGTLLIVNGWDDAKDNNRSKSVGAQVALTPTQTLTIYFNGMVGPERDDNVGDNRSLFDVCATWKATERFTLGGNYDYGTEENAPLATPKDVIWSGAAVYAKLGVSPRFSLALRLEQFDDRDGWRTGIAQRLREITLTPEFRVTDHLVLRGDLRLDTSDEDVFEKKTDETTDRQPTALFNALYVF